MPPKEIKDDSVKIERKTNSKERASWFSVCMFLWLMPLFRKGTKKDLTTQDLCQPLRSDQSEILSNKLEKNWCAELANAKKDGRKPSLLRALIRTFISSYILDGFLIFIQCMVCKSFQPIALAYLIDYFTAGSTATREQAYWYAGAVVGLSMLSVFIQHHTNLRQCQLGMRLRVACCSLLYRKVLRLSGKSLGQTTAGQLVNLMSNDVSRFDNVLIFLHYLWIMPFQIMLICYLIYTRVDVAALIGVAVLTMQTIPVQSYLSRLSSNLRKKIAVRTDDRVRIMSEIISGIQVIKMYAWERPFEKVVSMARAYELKAITSTSYLRGIFMAFMVFTERFTLFVTLLAYSLLGHRVTSATVFSLAQFYNTLQATMAIIYPMSISLAAECLVTIKRLEDFLTLEERPDLRLMDSKPNIGKGNVNGRYSKNDEDSLGCDKKKIEGNGFSNSAYDTQDFNLEAEANGELSVVIKDVKASWTSDKTALSLDGINIQIPKGKLCAFIGSVGSGKSSVLQLLLKELPAMSGTVNVQGTISFASQEAWLFVATVRNNILFGLPYDHKRYREVVRVCALEKDFQQFPRGDQTLVGERGVSLSGGQRARINLARAVYRQADVYLLDDPLSAVDAHVGRHLFTECIGRYLRGRTTILVTHQLHYLKAADIIVIMKNGSIENVGTYEELASSGQDFASLLAAMQESKDAHEGEEAKPVNKRHRKASQVSTSSAGSEPTEEDDEEAEELEGEEQLSGGMRKSTYWKYWKNGGSICFVLTMVAFMIMGQLSATACDFWVTFWTNQQNLEVSKYTERASLVVEEYPFMERLESRKLNDTYHYSDYEDTVTEFLNNDTLYSVVRPNASQAYQDTQFNINDKIGPYSTAEYLYIYTALITSCVILTLSRSMLFFKVCMNASKNLHDQMFHKILRGVMRFFDTNPSGRILNRFSKDIGAVDELLPRATIEAVQILLVMFSILFLVTVSNVWMLLPVLFILVLFYIIFLLYLSTAQDIKRLEGITRSPVFSHVSASLNGITTIRASGASKRLAYDFDIHQDLHTSAWYQYIACSSHLGFWLDTICTIFLAVVSFSFIIFQDDNALSGNVGLAISQSLILCGMLQFGVRQSAEIVSQMTSVERILQYNKIELEEGLEKGEKPTPEKWPKEGAIQFDHTFLRYSKESEPVLKNLNIKIHKGWKVGIVGRTGAGKSSLISALFRLANIEGGILIDDVETRYIAKQDLRSRISIIPQEPVLFSATVRYNLDPFGKYDDASLWSALEAVELKEAVNSLEFKVSEGGANFSLGQRQLVCLARAILTNNKILVLDEATANVDPQTDSFIQQTIRDKFASCTVLTIAHRLNTIMDSDRVLVMDTGMTAEFAHPHILLKNPDGHLSKMVKETGVEMALNLKKVAEEAYVKQGGLLDGDDEQIVKEQKRIDEE